MSDFAATLHTLRRKLGLTQKQMGERLGVSGNWVSLLESGDEEKARPSDGLIRMVEMMHREVEAAPSDVDRQSRDGSPRQGSFRASEAPRMIPVVGWAHAGEAASYEELPDSWANKVPTECRDQKAFAVQLEGDSMEPRFREGDLLVVMPGEEPYSGCFVVARFANDGVVFRRLERSGDRIQLVPLNDRYNVSEHAPEEFSWIHPVWGRWSQLWKR